MSQKKKELFSELESKHITEDEADDYSFSINMPIDNRYFRKYANFFTSIGYMAHQVAMIEDNIKQSMMMMTDDFDAVHEQTKMKNLGSLLSLYEIVFLAKFGNDADLEKYFYAVKFLMEKANKFRNIAVHSQWMFVEHNADLPCYVVIKKKATQYVVVSPKLMRKRAIFVHKVFNYFDDLRAVTADNQEGWDREIIVAAHKNLKKLAKKVLPLISEDH